MYHTILLRLDPVLHLSLALVAESQGRSVEQLCLAVLTTYREAEPASCVPWQEEISDVVPLAPLSCTAATYVAPVPPAPPAGRRRKAKRRNTARRKP